MGTLKHGNRIQLLQLVRDIEPIAGLGLRGGRAVVQHPVKAAARLRHQRLQRCRARVGDGADDAAAGRHDLHVGGAADTHLELRRPVAGPRQMRVRVHEAGNDRTPTGIQRRVRLHRRAQIGAPAHRQHAAVCHSQRGILDDAKLAHRRPAPRSGRSRQGDQLTDVVDEKVSMHGSRLRDPSFALYCNEPRAVDPLG